MTKVPKVRPARSITTAEVRHCSTCHHFGNSPRQLEAYLPGWRTLGSAFGSVRSGDGVCQAHARYLSPNCFCAQYTPLLDRKSGSPLASSSDAKPDAGFEAV